MAMDVVAAASMAESWSRRKDSDGSLGGSGGATAGGVGGWARGWQYALRVIIFQKIYIWDVARSYLIFMSLTGIKVLKIRLRKHFPWKIGFK